MKFSDLRSIDPDLISRSTPRLLMGAIQLYEYLDAARAKRNWVVLSPGAALIKDVICGYCTEELETPLKKFNIPISS